jgi:Family of unknown function (DUF5683)
MKTFKLFFAILFMSVLFLTKAQKDSSSVKSPQPKLDSTGKSIVQKDKKMSKPAKAALLSTIVPGLGQAYNKSYWKIPIVYALIGGAAYMTYRNQVNFKEFDYAYTQRLYPDSNILDKFSFSDEKKASLVNDYKDYTIANLQSSASYHRDWRDRLAIITVLMYAANIIEAHVDAHLKDFDVSDNLSLRFEPNITPTALGWQPSMRLSLNFKDKKLRNENSVSRLW